MEIPAVNKCEDHYLELWNSLESQLRHYIEYLVVFLPNMKAEQCYRAEQKLGRMLTLVDRVYFVRENLAVDFPRSIVVQQMPFGYFPIVHRVTCDLIQETLIRSRRDMDHQGKHALIISSLQLLYSQISAQNMSN